MNDPENGASDKNISTEHQEEGDARLPSDTLDRGQASDRDYDEEKIGRG